MDSKIYLAFLHYIWISQKKLGLIFENNENYEEVLINLNYAFLKRYKIREDYIKNILERKNTKNIDLIEKKLIERNVKLITINDTGYPRSLREISNPPFLLYLRWKLDNSPKIAIVWARNITQYWKNVISKIVPELSSYFTIVSWGAAWCDTWAHNETLNISNITIAVIGTWIDNDYPVPNTRMYNEIVEKGWAVISIFPIWEVWNPYNFPVRNEIVAWLSVWTIVVEAKQRSWSLITAQLTLDLGRDLFAIPWDIFKWNSAGCNNLIKTGQAKMVVKLEDVLEEYNCANGKNNIDKTWIKFDDEIEKDIYNILLLESLSIDELSKKLKLDTKTLSFKLSFMEIKQFVKKIWWWKYEVL